MFFFIQCSGHDTRIAAETGVSHGPIHQNHQAIAKTDKEIDVCQQLSGRFTWPQGTHRALARGLYSSQPLLMSCYLRFHLRWSGAAHGVAGVQRALQA